MNNQLLKLVNTKTGRSLLGIKDNLPIVKITPNSIHRLQSIKDGKATIQARFWNSDRVTEIFDPIISSREIAQKLGLNYYPHVMLATDVFNTADEGSIQVSNADWATARGLTTGSFVTDSGVLLVNTTYEIYRYGADFNTASLPDDAVISAATIRVYFIATNASNTDTTTFDIVGFTPADPAAIADGDFDQFGTTVFATVNLASITDAAYNTLTLDATGRANLSVTGYSNFGFRIGRDTIDSAPTGANRHDFQPANGANPMDLNVTYTSVGGTGDDRAYFM